MREETDKEEGRRDGGDCEGGEGEVVSKSKDGNAGEDAKGLNERIIGKNKDEGR